MTRVYSLEARGVPDGLGPDELDRSPFFADAVPIEQAAEAAERLGVAVQVLDHTEDVDPRCTRGWCKAPVVDEARPGEETLR